METSSRVASLCIIFPILLFLPFYKLRVKKESLIVGLKGEEENEALKIRLAMALKEMPTLEEAERWIKKSHVNMDCQHCHCKW